MDKSAPILLVEDSPGDFEITARAFKKAHFTNPLEHAASGEGALEYLRSSKPRPSLILLDLNMPGIGGCSTLEIIKQDQKLKEIPVIVLTSSDRKSDINRCYALGANGYILKQSDSSILAALIKRLKEYWLDTVELPSIFDEKRMDNHVIAGDSPLTKTVFSVSSGTEQGELFRPSEYPPHEVHLSPAEVYQKIMGSGPHKLPDGQMKLTAREIETLTWVAKGKSRWEVGTILGLSEDAIKTRLEKSRQKLGATNTTHAIAIALQHGLLKL